jgi:hypothetical protein
MDNYSNALNDGRISPHLRRDETGDDASGSKESVAMQKVRHHGRHKVSDCNGSDNSKLA